MYIEEPNENPAADQQHKVVIDQRKKIVVTGVQDVDSFNESEIIMLTNNGFITVVGEDLHISKLNLVEGQIAVEGTIQNLDYADHEQERRKGSFLSRAFK